MSKYTKWFGEPEKAEPHMTTITLKLDDDELSQVKKAMAKLDVASRAKFVKRILMGSVVEINEEKLVAAATPPATPAAK